MNLVGYDAAALGSHEFNYGIPILRTFEDQLGTSRSSARTPSTRRPSAPGVQALHHPHVPGRPRSPAPRSACSAWTNLASRSGTRPTSRGGWSSRASSRQAKVRAEMKKKGCDLIIVSAHPGPNTSSSYGDALCPTGERVVLVGRAGVRRRDPGRPRAPRGPLMFVRNKRTGQVPLCEPAYWGMRVALMDPGRPGDVDPHGDLKWVLVGSGSQVLNSNTVDPRPEGHRGSAGAARHGRRLRELAGRHLDRGDVSGRAVVGTSRSSTSSTTSRPRRRQRRPLREAATLPVLSIAAPFNRQASFPSGRVTVRDVAGPLHLRQHAARRTGVGRGRAGLPILGALLQRGRGRSRWRR